MKPILSFLLFSSLFVASLERLQAQSPSVYSIDSDMMMLRNTVAPDFRHHYDDYLQYAPAAVMVGMKACGYKGRSSWGRMLVSDAFSAATMAVLVNGIKYSVGRMRPDGSAHNSFPSGHTATAFMTATMLHKEYEGRSPWFSIGGYAVATLTGLSRILNNRHWMTDVVAGAAIGIGSVHLGYFITDKIFKDRHLNPDYECPVFYYDPAKKHYVVELIIGRRFVMGPASRKEMGGVIPIRGSLAGIQAEIPIIANVGICGRLSASGMVYSGGVCSDLYTASAGPYWNLHFAKILEFQAKAAAGWARLLKRDGVSLGAGVSLSLIVDNNFKIKAFGEFESISRSPREPWINMANVGFSTGFFW